MTEEVLLHDDSDIPLFQVPTQLSRDVLLLIISQICERVQLVLAPFGLPREVMRRYGKAEFIRHFTTRFQEVLELVSERVYAENDVGHCQMALSLEYFVETVRDHEVMSAVHDMNTILERMYSPSPVVEVPSHITKEQMIELICSTARHLYLIEQQVNLFPFLLVVNCGGLLINGRESSFLASQMHVFSFSKRKTR
jgi:hypothetical protein